MKKTLLLVAVGAMLASCGPKSFTISGEIKSDDANGKKVCLIEKATRDTLAVAEIADQKFVLTGATTEQKLCAVVYNTGDRRTSRSADIILQNAEYTIDSFFVASGSKHAKLQNVLADFVGKSREYSKTFYQKRGEIMKDENLSKEEKDAQVDAARDEYYESFKNVLLNVINSNPNTLLVALLLPNVDDMETAKGIYEASNETIKEYPSCKKYYNRIINYLAHDAGCMFEDFTIENGNLDGTPAKLSDYVGKGKYILVDFWASWCGPCQGEIPHIKEMYNKYHGDKFDVLSVGVWDEREKTIAKAKEHEIPWNQIIDAQTIPTDMYGINGIPTLILFDPDGKIVSRELRGVNGSLQAKLAELLGE